MFNGHKLITAMAAAIICLLAACSKQSDDSVPPAQQKPSHELPLGSLTELATEISQDFFQEDCDRRQKFYSD